MNTLTGLQTLGSTALSKSFQHPVIEVVERVRRYGIECTGPYGDGICFRGGEWEVGGEYIQKLTVKNVSTKMRKIKYKLPESAYFSMGFPERIDLPPGVHVDIDVVFRPVENYVK